MAIKMMTERELLNNIINGTEITEAMKEKAVAMLEALDKKNSKRKETGSKNQQENKVIKEKIITALVKNEIELVDGCATAKFVSKYFNFSTQKASPLLNQLADEGNFEKQDIKLKNSKAIGYKLLESVKIAELAKLDETAENAETTE